MKNRSNYSEPTPIEGVYKAQSSLHGPTVVVVGGTHGDEPTGAEVIEPLRKEPVQSGTLYTVMANIEAIKIKKRFVREDLNRCFGEIGKDIDKNNLSSEKKRAEELKEIYAQADIFIDIHGTILP